MGRKKRTPQAGVVLLGITKKDCARLIQGNSIEFDAEDMGMPRLHLVVVGTAEEVRLINLYESQGMHEETSLKQVRKRNQQLQENTETDVGLELLGEE